MSSRLAARTLGVLTSEEITRWTPYALGVEQKYKKNEQGLEIVFAEPLGL